MRVPLPTTVWKAAFKGERASVQLPREGVGSIVGLVVGRYLQVRDASVATFVFSLLI